MNFVDIYYTDHGVERHAHVHNNPDDITRIKESIAVLGGVVIEMREEQR